MKKERPILFSTPMVQALLAGRKTQTRRTTGLDKLNENPGNWEKVTPDVYTTCNEEEDDPWSYCDFQTLSGEYMACPRCQYGQVGDMLWVRETFIDSEDSPCAAYHEEPDKYPRYDFKTECPEDQRENITWKPSIHMPKAAARIWLEITDIRVERVQDINEDDSVAEGIAVIDGKLEDSPTFMNYLQPGIEYGYGYPENSFASLWKFINGAESWEANPWVWVVSFKVLSTTGKPDKK